jgi:hypothetical protein
MHLRILLTLSVCLIACQNTDASQMLSPDMRGCLSLPDLAPPQAQCAAASGLTGDNLVCVDFSLIPDQSLGSPPPSQLTGWDFVSNCGSMNWEIAGGQLQITNFGGFKSTCGLTLPQIDLKQAKYSRYNSITLSLQQIVDLDPGTSTPNQYAEVYLGTANPALLVTQMTNTVIGQQMTVTINKQNLPVVLSNVYQWLLQVSSVQGNNTKNGWQISSVAVMGNQ